MGAMEIATIQLTVTITLISLQCYGSSLFSMLSNNQHYIVDVGSRLTMKCEFYQDRFNLFDNPVQWKKDQYDEISEVNVLGNVKEPFLTTGRFEVSYEPTEPTHTMALTIKDMSIVDSGNYTCDVSGPGEQLLGVVKYTIHVKENVEDVTIHGANNRLGLDVFTGNSITLVEDEPAHIRCISRGGSPPPEMEIFLGRADCTKYFRFDSVPSITGDVGFRYLHMTTMLVTDHFRVSSTDDGKKLNCIAKVPGLPQFIKSMLISVQFAPRIDCQSSTAYLGERNTRLICDVTSNPPVTSWYWMLDDIGTTLSEGEERNGYWTIITRRDGNMHLELYLRVTSEASFRSYIIHTMNSVDSSSQQVSLKIRYREPDSKSMSSRYDQPPYRQQHSNNRLTDTHNSLVSAASLDCYNHLIFIVSLCLTCIKHAFILL